MKQLVDLNGDTTNFDLTFSVTSKDKALFDVIVVDQTTLDSNPSLDYKHVTNGSISGNIVSDKGVYQNYFLMLKADTPCQCEVITEIKEIPVKPMTPDEFSDPGSKEKLLQPKNTSMVNWTTMLIFAAVVGAVLYYLFVYSKEDEGHTSSPDRGATVHKPAPKLIPKLIPKMAPKPAPKPAPVAPLTAYSSQTVSAPLLSPVKTQGRSVNESLLARLNNLPMRRN